MKKRVEYYIPLLALVILASVSYFAGQCGIKDSCLLSEYFGANLFKLIQPLYLFSLFSIPAVLFLPFVSKKVFSLWIKFAIIWVAVSIFIIASSPVALNTWFHVFDYTRGNVARLLAIVFSSISLVLIIVASIATRKKH